MPPSRVFKKAGPEDCEELCRRRAELELALLGESMDFKGRVRICGSMVGWL
jgi:hypothetical protein